MESLRQRQTVLKENPMKRPDLDTQVCVALNAPTHCLFTKPEGLDFDAHGNLWVANNNDGNGAA
jgi:hypothetical protein